MAAEGAPFRVKEKATGREFLAQLRPIDDALMRHVDIHNSLDHPGIVQMHRVLRDEKLALVVFDKWVLILILEGFVWERLKMVAWPMRSISKFTENGSK